MLVCMETIYIDSLFILNLAIDYLLLLVTGRICSAHLRRGFIALGAAVGAVYSVLVVLPFGAFLASWPCKLAFAAMMLLTAYWGEKHIFRCSAVFLAVSAAFGGAVYAVSIIGGTGTGHGLYVRVPFRILLLSFAVCYAVLSIVFRRSADKTERMVLPAVAELDGRKTDFLILHDTGNGLYDPVSGLPVCIAEARTAAALFPGECQECFALSDPLEMFLALSGSCACRGRFRLIPYSSVGNPAGLLPAFRPDSLTIGGKTTPSLIAVTSSLLCADGEYNAVF